MIVRKCQFHLSLHVSAGKRVLTVIRYVPEPAHIPFVEDQSSLFFFALVPKIIAGTITIIAKVEISLTS